MKFRRHVPKLVALVLSWLLVGYIAYVYAQTTLSTQYIMGGIYPGAPSYTIWDDGSSYYAKNANGQIDYSGTNATQVMQSAIDNLDPIFSGTVLIKAGEYVDVSLNITQSYTKLIGEGKATHLKYTKSGGTVISIGDNAQPEFIEISDMLIYESGALRTAIGINDFNSSHTKYNNLVLQGFDTAIKHESSISNFEMNRVAIGYCTIGIDIILAHDSMIQNCMISACNDTGIYARGSYNLQIIGSSIEDSDDLVGDGIGIMLGTVASGVNTRTLVSNCFFNHLKYGIKLENASVCRVLGNTFFKIMYSAINDASGNQIEENEINTWYSNSVGILVLSHYSRISHNYIAGGYRGIVVNYTSGSYNYLLIHGNHIGSMTGAAILLNATAYSEISGNVLKSNVWGIYLAGTSIYNLISDTITRYNTNGGLVESGSSDYNNIIGCAFIDYYFHIGAATHITSCWNTTTWVGTHP